VEFVARLTLKAFSRERRIARASGNLPTRTERRETEMATTWEMIAACIQDAVRAEDLVKELAFRRELRLDPQKALSAFELRSKPAR
jgi:hypothetical protein